MVTLLYSCLTTMLSGGAVALGLDAADGLLDRLLEPLVGKGLVQEVDGVELEAVEGILGVSRGEDETALLGQVAGYVRGR